MNKTPFIINCFYVSMHNSGHIHTVTLQGCCVCTFSNSGQQRSHLRPYLPLEIILHNKGIIINLCFMWGFCPLIFFLFACGIRKMKLQLQQLRWKGAKTARHEYQERSCARCQKSLGLLVNRGAVCNGCSHRVCSECRVCLNPCLWKCTICYAHG